MINVSSFQSLGAVDGPGVRFVVFLKGCNLRCKYCHNPETLSTSQNELYTPEELYVKIKRYDSYIKENGGVTFSGGEPLLQAKELLELFKMLSENGYHIALDTNGSILNDHVKELIKYVDLILLDVKMPDDKLYLEYTGLGILNVMRFLKYVLSVNKKIWIRQVVIEGVNDTKENVAFLKELKKNPQVEKIELLPFKKICIEKYKSLNMKFQMEDFKETDISVIKRMENELCE